MAPLPLFRAIYSAGDLEQISCQPKILTRPEKQVPCQIENPYSAGKVNCISIEQAHYAGKANYMPTGKSYSAGKLKQIVCRGEILTTP